MSTARHVGVWLVCAWLAGAGAAHAEATPEVVTSTGLTGADLGAQATQLTAADPQLRAASVSGLSQIALTSLPGMRARLDEIARTRPSHDEVLRVLVGLRHAAGSRRADDDVDLLQGVLPLLAEERSAVVAQVVEPLLYMRSLQALADPRAHLELARFPALDEGAWDNELRLLRKRMGLRLLPALLALRSHESADARRFAQAGLSALGADDPKLGLSIEDPYLLSQVVRGYGNALDFAAMPGIVRLAGHDSQQVRQAARAAIARYGKNAIWPVRELYEEVASRSADKSWDAERCARELYAVLDRAQYEEAHSLLAQGLARYRAGDLRGMREQWDALLARYPELPERETLAPGYAALGAQRLTQDDLVGALDSYRRALRLAPQAKSAAQWHAQVEFVSAELSLTHGIVDLPAYDRALAFDPNHAAAHEAKDRLSGARGQRIRTVKRLAAVAALLLLLVFGWLVNRTSKAAADRAAPDADPV